ILARCRPLRVVEVPFRFARRQAGRSKAGFGVTAQFLRQLIALAAAAGELRKMACFAAVGLSGVAVNFAAFASLHHLGVALAPAAALACAAAIANNFTGNELVTFRAAAQADPGARAVTRRFLRFFAFSLIGLGLDTAAVAMLTPEIGWVLALALGIGLAASWNFAANATLTWPVPAPAPSRPVAPKAVAVAAEPLRVAAERLSRPILEGPAASGARGWASPTGNGGPLALRASPGCRE
ncbi:MAG: GtrA family protein, partial [Terriglobales bacterium]